MRVAFLFPFVLAASAGATGADLAPAPAAPPTTPELSRRAAVVRALEANPRVRKSHEAVREMDGRVTEARADALPDLSAAGAFTRYRDPSFLNSPSFDNLPPEFRDALEAIPANQHDASVVLRQTLFSFKLNHAIKAAKLGKEYGQEGVRAARQEVALSAVQAYDGLLLARAKVQVGQKAVRQKEIHLEQVTHRRDAGVATDLDVLRAEVDLANQKAQQLALEGQADLARSRLNTVMERPVDTPVEPTDVLEDRAFDISLDDATREALAARSEVKLAELTDQIYDQVEEVTRADRRPKLDFFGVWGWSVRQPHNFLKSDFEKWNLNIALTVPVFDGFRVSGKLAQVQAQRAQARQDRLALESSVRLEAKSAWDRLRVARAVLDAASLNVSQAQRAMDMVQANYGYGAATNLDVVDSQAALTLAESLRVQALWALADARASLRYVMGRDPLEDPAPEEIR